MDEPTASADWVAIRDDYEAGVLTRNAVAAKHSVTYAEIALRARNHKWVRTFSDITDRRILIFKLLALLERQIDLVDEKMKRNELPEVSVLMDMVRGLDKLITIEKAEAGQQAQEVESKEMRDLQRKLEKRINAITKG